MSIHIDANQAVKISNSAHQLIERAAILYHAGDSLHPSVAEIYLQDLDAEFESIAEALGYSVEKIEHAVLEAAE